VGRAWLDMLPEGSHETPQGVGCWMVVTQVTTVDPLGEIPTIVDGPVMVQGLRSLTEELLMEEIQVEDPWAADLHP
jgi:hypothetical protein